MVARQAHNLEVAGSSPAPATVRAGSTTEPDLSAPAADVEKTPLPASAAGISPAISAELVRLHDAGMGVDAIGARFRIAYATIATIVAAEHKRRADALAPS